MACSAVALAAISPAAHAQASPADSEAAQQSELLLDRGNSVTRLQRLEAARRLTRMDNPASRAALAAALQQRADSAIQGAAAVALAEDETPDPSHIDSLFTLIQPDAPGDLARPAARALAKFKDNPIVVQRLIERVTGDKRGESSRRAAIEALGYVSEKRSASTLIELISSDAESVDIRESAMAALRDMTGAQSNGSDVSRWFAWWRENSSLSDAQFKTNVLAGRAARFDELKPGYESLVASLMEVLSRAYRSASDERRTELLLSWMSSGQREIRAISAMIVRDEKASAAVIPEPVQQRLREMVGDSDSNVRFAVAKALAAINYPPALESMLSQLSIESNPDVRAELARAIAPIQDLRSVPLLLRMVGDADQSVVRSAAIALRDLGPKLVADADTAMIGQVTAALRSALRSTGGAGSEMAREAVVEAIVPLQRVELFPDLQQLLVPRETARVRQTAVRALAGFGPNAVDAVAPMLADSEPTVRLEAARAMGTIGRASELSSLKRMLSPPGEADPSVQGQAWQAIQAIAQKEDTPWKTLAVLAGDFAGNTEEDLTRRLAILRLQQAKLLAANKPDELLDVAEVCHNIGDVHMQFKPPQAAEAIEFYKLAMDNYVAVNNPIGPDTMIAKLTDAMLRAERYGDGMNFAQEVIAQNPGNLDVVGPKVKAEVERLANAGEDAKALLLIRESERLNPLLPDRLRQQLAEIEISIQRRQNDQLRDRATPPSGPRGGIALPAVGPIRIA